jgi:hypothetical protein
VKQSVLNELEEEPSSVVVDRPCLRLSCWMLLEHGARGVIIDNYESALLSKHEDWSHESEFRLLVIDDPSNAFMLPIGPECVAGIVVGPRFDVARHGCNVKAFARRFAIEGQVRKLDWTHGNCALSLVAL